jgi:hypothetical protein
MEIIINDNVFNFESLRYVNGQKAKVALDKDKNPIQGKSGETLRFDLTSGGCVFLTPDQYQIVK